VPEVGDQRLCCEDPLAGGVLDDSHIDGDLIDDPCERVLRRVPLKKLS
jgi:hypothetical protein